MIKIPSIYLRDWTTGQMTSERNPTCQWVFDGEGVAYRKWDGSACLYKYGFLWKRYDAKNERRAAKVKKMGGFPCQAEPDPVTKHWPWWVPVTDGPDDKFHRAALDHIAEKDALAPGTYELVGPKVNGGKDGFERHVLISHKTLELVGVPTAFHELSEWLAGRQMEGIVWHHPDGRMAKIKKRDFGHKW